MNFPNTSEPEQTTALVLSGGGVKGAFQAGALEVLRNAGFTFDAISGVSVGSLNGAMLATRQFEQLQEIWQQITPEQVLRKHSYFRIARRYLSYKLGLSAPPVSRYNNKPLQQLLKNYLLNKKVSLPFYFGYVKLESGTYVNATIRHTDDHRIDEADLNRLLASTAIPVYFNPTHIGGQTAVDGGLRNISPISEVLPFNPDRMVIIPTQPVKPQHGETEVRDILEIAFRSINIMLDEIFHEDIDRFLTVNRLVKQADTQGAELNKSNGQPYKYIEPIIIDPKESLGDGLDFRNQRSRELLERGRKRAREVLKEGEQNLST